MRFANIVGHQEVKRRLTAAVARNHLAHALLFAGPEGSAKLAMVMALVSYLQCQNRQSLPDGSADACGQCPACHKVAKLQHPDIHFIFPVAPTKGISGDEKVVSQSFMAEWRAFLPQNLYGNLADWQQAADIADKQAIIRVAEGRNITSALSLKSYEGPYKIMVIWLAEHMNQACANAILKILEEPPANTQFLLVAQSVEQLLATILSRTQLITIPAFTDQELQQALTGQYGLAESQAEAVVPLVAGNLREALQLAGDTDNESYQQFQAWMRLCYERNFSQLVAFADQFGGLGKTAQRNLLHTGLNLLRQTLVYPYADALVRLPDKELTFAENFSKVANPDRILKMSDLLNKHLYYLERNANPRLSMLDASLQIAMILRT